MSNPGGATPQTAPAVTTSAPAAPAASSLSAPDLTSQIQAANNPTAIRNIMRDLTRKGSAPVPAPAPAAPATPPPAAPAAEVPAELPPAEAPAEIPAEAPPAETPGETPEAPAAEGEQPPETPEGSDPLEVPSANKLRIKLPDSDRVGRLATQFMRRNPDWSMEDALVAAKKQLGVAQPETTAATPPPVPGQPQMPATIEAVDQAVDALEAEGAKAATEFRMEDYHKIRLQIKVLDRQRTKLEFQAKDQQQANAAKYDTDFTASERQASEFYADAANPASEFGKRMAEIDTTLEETGDPLFHAADKPLRIAQMVAREMNIAPRKKSAIPAKPATAPAKPTTPAPKKQMLPNGGSSTTPAAPPPAVSPDLANIRTVADLQKFNKNHGIKQF